MPRWWATCAAPATPTFPFVLEDGQQRPLFVTPRGDVYDQAGQRVAKLHD